MSIRPYRDIARRKSRKIRKIRVKASDVILVATYEEPAKI